MNIVAKTISEEQRKKISESMKGRKLSEEHKGKLRESMKGVNTWAKGRTVSEETKNKLSKIRKGKKRKPFSAETREKMRSFSNNFIEVYISTPIEECIKRDPKGLYKKAISGEIKYFTGISAEYEIPKNHDIEIDTSDISIEDSVKKIYAKL